MVRWGFVLLGLCFSSNLVAAKAKRCLLTGSLPELESSMQFTSVKKKSVYIPDRKEGSGGVKRHYHVEIYTHRASGEVYTVYSTYRDEDDGGNTIGWIEAEGDKVVASISDGYIGDCKAFAKSAKVMCKKVEDKWSARFCVDALIVENLQEFEGPNAYLTTDSNTAFRAMGSILNEGKVSKEIWDTFHRADYLIAAFQFTDDGNLYYYALENGSNVKPQILAEYNKADLKDSHPKSAKRPGVWSLEQTGIPRWPYDEFKSLAQ